MKGSHAACPTCGNLCFLSHALLGHYLGARFQRVAIEVKDLQLRWERQQHGRACNLVECQIHKSKSVERSQVRDLFC